MNAESSEIGEATGRPNADAPEQVGLPTFACLCVTFVRPQQLANVIACFERFSYPETKRELIILDDMGQYPTEPSGRNWSIISVKRRFATLGEKRNALAAMTGSAIDAFAIMDDDDAYCSWTLDAHAWALSQGTAVSMPSWVFNEVRSGSLEFHWARGLFHAAWAIDRDAFRAVGGYPALNNGEDQKLGGRLTRAGYKSSNPIDWWPPYFIHRWGTSGSVHLSAMGGDGYDRMLNQAKGMRPVTEITPNLSWDWDMVARSFIGASSISVNQLSCFWREAQSMLPRRG